MSIVVFGGNARVEVSTFQSYSGTWHARASVRIPTDGGEIRQGLGLSTAGASEAEARNKLLEVLRLAGDE